MKKKIKLLSNIGKMAEKIESDAKDFREKYPEIAKMTVADVVATDIFTAGIKNAVATVGIKNAVANYRGCGATSYYAFRSLKIDNTLEPDNFRKEYIACMDKESTLPAIKRAIILAIGNYAYRRTVKLMMDNYDSTQKGEA